MRPKESTKRLKSKGQSKNGLIGWLQLCWEEFPELHTYFLQASDCNTQPLKGATIELSSKWQYLLTWNTHNSSIGPQGWSRAWWLRQLWGREKGKVRKFSEGESDPRWGVVYRRQSHCILREGRLYLSLATGGWWGANLLRGLPLESPC